MAEITIPRTGAHLRKLFEILLSYPDGLQAGEALKKLAASVQMTAYEAGLYESSGKPRFEKIIRFATIDVGKAGWLLKNKGIWSVTEAGKKAIRARQGRSERSSPIPSAAQRPTELAEGSGPIADAIRARQLRTGVGTLGEARGGEGQGTLLGEPVPSLQPHRVSAADGRAVEVAPIVVEAGLPLTSQDQGYDPRLQPRQPYRAASQAQVRNIAFVFFGSNPYGTAEGATRRKIVPLAEATVPFSNEIMPAFFGTISCWGEGNKPAPNRAGFAAIGFRRTGSNSSLANKAHSPRCRPQRTSCGATPV